MAQPSEQLAGRAAELRSLEAALTGLSRGRAAAVALVGEPGIGKTRLLAELAARAEAERLLVLSGHASELEREIPFWVFVDALDEHVDGLAPGRLAALDEHTRAELAHVLPSLDGTAAGEGARLQQERYRTHRAVRRLLEALADERPLVVVLDDLQWADSGAIELLGALLRRPPAATLLLALAIRPRQVPELLSGAIERAAASGLLTRIDVGALSAEAARTLLGDAVSGPVAAALYEEAGGNPFYLQQLARALDRRLEQLPAAGEVSLSGVEVPRLVAAALAEELAVLSADARRALQGAAVAGDPFELELAAVAAGMPEPETVARLDELLALDLVRPTDVPRRFRFRHPLVRQAVYEATPGGWRLGAHERSAAALAARGAPATARAHHVEHSARHGDQAAIAVLQEAGAAAVQRTPAGAAGWFGAALRLLPADAPAEQRLALLSARAGSLAATGGFEAAHDALLESLRIVPAADASRRIELTVACAGIEQVLGAERAARARLVAALDGLADPRSGDAAALMIELGVGAFYRMEREEARAWAARALDVARALDAAPLEAAAAALNALVLAFDGAAVAAEEHRARSAALVDAMPDAELATRLDALAHLAGAEDYLARFADSLRHAERGVAIARATGQGDLFPVLIPAVNAALFGLGRVAESVESLDGPIEGARLMGNDQALAWSLLSGAVSRMMCGDVPGALTAATEAVELSGTLGVGLVSSYAGMILGAVLIEHGDHLDGAEHLVRWGGGPALPDSPGGWRAWDLDRLTRAWLALGRTDDAERAAADAEAVAAATGLRFTAALAGRARARVALAQGDAVAAADHAVASALDADAVGAVAEAGVSRILAGRALGAAGDRDRAVAELERAVTTLEACGALRYRDEAERELGKLGRRRYRRTRPGRLDGSGLETLTERELQIARLLVARRTNTQIAEELFLSRKTVETHVRHLFEKLAVSSRVEVARAVERADRAARS